ncbi:hypothetical protein GCM10028795_19170 [Lysobacter olei]
MCLQSLEQAILKGEAQLLEMGRVLEFRDQADGAPQATGFGGDQFDHFIQRGNRELAVMGGGPKSGKTFVDAQRLQFGEGEVFGKPPFEGLAVDNLLPAAVRELGPLSYIGRAAEFALMSGDEHSITRGHQIGLDEIRAVGDGLGIRRQRVLRTQSAGAAVGDHERAQGQWHSLMVARRSCRAGLGAVIVHIGGT